MPIYLPPLSRRQFLGRTLAAAAALATGAARAENPGGCSTERWALFSDIHVSANPQKISHGYNMTDHLKSVVAEVNALPLQPSGVMISGDLAFYDAEAGDYAAVIQLLEPLRKNGLPVHMTLGNHDDRERFWEVLGAPKTEDSTFAGRQTAVIPGATANWFVLDSLVSTLHTPGLLGAEQRAWLARELDARPNKPAIIVIHHHPGPLSGPLEDTKELFEILRPRAQVKAWIFGHTHDWKLDRDESGIHLINLPPVGFPFHPKKPVGWVLVDVDRDGLQLKLQCVNKSHPRQGESVNLKWRV